MYILYTSPHRSVLCRGPMPGRCRSDFDSLSAGARQMRIEDILDVQPTAEPIVHRRYSDGGFAPKARSRSRNKRWKTGWVMYAHVCPCMYVSYVCMYICMFFTYISQFTAHTEFKSVPFASPLNATLLRNEFSWVRYPTSAWHVKIAKKSTKIPE